MIKNTEKFIPLSVPNLKGNELKYVSESITSEWVSTAGADITKFELAIKEYTHSPYACAVQSGTAGLHLCLRHFGITTDDIVLVPTLTFIAPINTVIYQNAQPVFFDCDEHLMINIAQIKKYLEQDCEIIDGKTFDKSLNKQIKAIIAVHIFGDTCDIAKLMKIADKYNLIIIEDATEALGSKLPTGEFAGTLAHAGVYSFNGNKIITTGGGGMVVSNSKETIEHISYLSQQAKDDMVYFINNEVGYNYRMTNLQACLGRAQMEQLNRFIEIKRNNYHFYKELLKNKEEISLLDFSAEDNSNYWFYSLVIESGNSQTRDKFIEYMSENSVQTRPIWKLNHTQKPFLNYKKMDCPVAESYYKKIVNIPCSSNLTEYDVERVCKLIKDFDFRN